MVYGSVEHYLMYFYIFSRWGMEGKFSVNRPEVFLQDKCKAPNITPFVTNTYHGIQNEIGFTASFLEINSIPTPDLYSLVERYCFELQLPGKRY